MEYIQSRSGCRQILFQGYNYNRERREAPNDPKSVWRCVEYSGPCQCPGRMTVIRGKPITGAPHNHAPFSAKINVKRIMNRLKIEALDTSRDLDPTEIIEELTRDISDEVRAALPSGQMMRRMIQRLRNKDRGSGQSILQHQIKRISRRSIKSDVNDRTENMKQRENVANGIDSEINACSEFSDYLLENSQPNPTEENNAEESLIDFERSFKFWRRVGNLGLLPDFVQEIKTFLDDILKVILQDSIPPNHSQEYKQMIEYSKQLSFIVTELGLTSKLKAKLTQHQNVVVLEQEQNRRELIALRKKLKSQEAKQEELARRNQCIRDLIREQAVLLIKSEQFREKSISDNNLATGLFSGGGPYIQRPELKYERIINGYGHNDQESIELQNEDDQTSIFFGHGLNDIKDSAPTPTSAIFELGQALGIFHEGQDQETEIRKLKKSLENANTSAHIENNDDIKLINGGYIDIISSATISSVTSSLVPIESKGTPRKRIKALQKDMNKNEMVNVNENSKYK